MVIFNCNNTNWNSTYVNAGTLEAMTPLSLQVQMLGNTNGVWVASGAVLAVLKAKTNNAPNGFASADINTLFNGPTDNGVSSPGLVDLVPGSSFGVDVVSGDTFTQTGNFPYGQAGVGLVKMGGGTMLLNGSTYAAATTIPAGTLQRTYRTTAPWTVAPGRAQAASSTTPPWSSSTPPPRPIAATSARRAT